MATSIKQIRRFFFLLLFIAELATGQERQPQKWHFETRNGNVEVWARQITGNQSRQLTILELSSDRNVNVTDEAALLDKVLNDLSAKGLTPDKLSRITLRLNEKDARARVASYAAQSPRWRPALRTKSIAKVYPLVVGFLNASHAYQEWEGIFGKRGLQMQVVGVEEVMMGPFGKSGAKCPPKANCNDLLVPDDALMQINLVPEDNGKRPFRNVR